MKTTINGIEYETFQEGKTFKELGIDPNRKFIVCDSRCFKVGDILVLNEDDDTKTPYFKRLSDGNTSYCNIKRLAYYKEPLVIKEKDGIKVGDKVEYKGYKGKEYKGYVAVIDPTDCMFLLRLNGYSCHKADSCWNEDWYPEHEKKEEYNCIWSKKEHFTVVNENIKEVYKTNQLTKPNGNKFMSNIIKFAKNLTLSDEEKTLRKVGLKNECGEFTEEAQALVLQKLLNDHQAYLVDIANKMIKEEKSK